MNKVDIGEYNTLVNKYNELYKENQELKKQVEKKYKKVGTLTNEILYEENTKLQQENEKLNHYKLLYQKVKDRNDKAIDFLENHRSGSDWYDTRDLLDILKGNNEE
jgi:regulator of replication initiation timing